VSRQGGINVKIGSDLVYIKLHNQAHYPVQPYCKLTTEMLRNISCMPKNIFSKIHFPENNVRLPSIPLENALKNITYNTPISFRLDPNKQQHKTFLAAINQFTKHLQLPYAILAITAEPKLNERNEILNCAPLQLTFYRSFLNTNGDIDVKRGREPISVDLNGLHVENKQR
jgi:hypothetical protein